jgi:hypothetical protein
LLNVLIQIANKKGIKKSATPSYSTGSLCLKWLQQLVNLKTQLECTVYHHIWTCCNVIPESNNSSRLISEWNKKSRSEFVKPAFLLNRFVTLNDYAAAKIFSHMNLQSNTDMQHGPWAMLHITTIYTTIVITISLSFVGVGMCKYRFCFS